MAKDMDTDMDTAPRGVRPPWAVVNDRDTVTDVRITGRGMQRAQA